MKGLSYNNRKRNKLLNQLNVNDMTQLVQDDGFYTISLKF